MLSKSLYSVIAVCVLSCLVWGTGCGKGGGGGGGGSGEVGKQATKIELNGHWGRNCAAAGEVAEISATKVEYDFGAAVKKTTTAFQDDKCQAPMLALVEYGSYSIGNEVGSKTGVYELDQNYATATVTPLSAEAVEGLYLASACGFSDWALNQPRDITAKTSDDPVASRCWRKTPRTAYDVARIENNQLFMGKYTPTADRSTPQKRPTAIDTEKPFTRM